MRQFKRVIPALLLALLLAGCSVGAGSDIDTLLRAPQLSDQTGAVQRALNSYLGMSATLKYPATGDFLSPFLFGDWDGDGTQEAAVLYTGEAGANVWLAVLEPGEDGTWKVTQTVEGLSDTVQSVSYANLRDAASQQILVGYGSAQGDQYLAVYLYDGGTGLQVVIQQAYTDMILTDITGTGDTVDLILALPTETETGGINLQLLTNYNGLFKSTQTLSLGAGVFSGCAALHAGTTRAGKPYLVADGWAGGGGSYLASAIVVYNDRSGYLEPYAADDGTDLYHTTLRYDAALQSTDIDGNGTVDIPTVLDDGGTLEIPLDKSLVFLLWKDYTSARGGDTCFGVYDMQYDFFVPLPESMHGSILIKRNITNTGWLVCNAEGNISYCELRVVEQSQAQSSEFRRIANFGSQQLQARMITPYYGLDIEKIVDGTVLMEN